MRLLAAFMLLCLLLAGVIVWRFLPAGDTDSQPAAAPAPTATLEMPEPSPAPAAVPSDTAQPGDTVQQARLPAAPAPAPEFAVEPTQVPPASAPVHWADTSVPAAERRLAAARATLAGDPEHPTALRDELAALRALDRWSEAAQTLARLMRLEPDELDWRLQHIEAVIRQGLWAQAIDPLVQFVERQPDNARAWLYLAAARQTLGHLSEAERSWTRVLELAPDLPSARARRGEVRLALHDWAGAAEDLELAVAADPGDAGTALYLAAALAGSGREQEARRCALSLLERQPQNVRALNYLAELAWQAYLRAPQTSPQEHDAALDWWRRSLALDPAQPAIRARIAEAGGSE